MPAEYLDHFNIRCRDLERTRAFYCDILGLRVGPRPAVSIPGYWLYCGEFPQLHLIARDLLKETIEPGSTGAIDHVAFRLSHPDEMIERLKARDVPYTERSFPDIGVRQIVVHDPDGIMVELNYEPAAGSRPE
jgi:catechol 2,3-dioxygenase-like lactoylglutathione lyase family enzyme